MVVKLYTAPEVASQLGIELDTLYRYARSGAIRGVKIGKLWRFTDGDISEFLERRRYRSLTTPAPDATPGESQLLPELLRSVARGPGDRGALIGANGRVGFAEANALSDRLAAALIRAGVEPGDRVLVILPNCIEFVLAMFAVWKAGAVLVADSTAVRPASLRHILRDSRPKAGILDRGIAEQLDDELLSEAPLSALFIKDREFTLTGVEGIRVESLDVALERETLAGELPWTTGSPDDVVSITYTSGSTGLPKGVMHSHESWLASALFSRDYPRVTSADVLMISIPLYHGLAFRQILSYLLAEATIVISADVYQMLKTVADHRPTALVLVPAACNIVLAHFAGVLLGGAARLRYVEIGSAALAPERLRQLQQLLPSTAIHLPYGLTEARVGFLTRGDDGLLNRVAAVSPGLEVRVVDSSGRDVAAGETGEIVLRGRGLMRGYWGSTSDRQESLRRDGFPSGDVGRRAASGEIELLGRLDDVLKIGGKKVIPGEVEMSLARHPQVAECAVVARPDPTGLFEQKLHAFVVLREDNGATEKELIAFCREQLEPHKLPSEVHFRRSLPKSSVGKLLRQSL